MKSMKNARDLIDKLNVRNLLKGALRHPNPVMDFVHLVQEVLFYRKNMGVNKWTWIKGHAVKVLGKTFSSEGRTESTQHHNTV